MWYWTPEKDGVWRINDDNTRDGKPLEDLEIIDWLEQGNIPEEYSSGL